MEQNTEIKRDTEVERKTKSRDSFCDGMAAVGIIFLCVAAIIWWLNSI